MELESRLCQLGQDLTTVPEREQRTNPRYLGTESCLGTWVPINFVVSFFHQLVPIGPQSPSCWFLRSVSLGSGVCSGFVRSVSPCRLVPEVRLFPPSLRCFWPSARRVSAFFFLLPFRVSPALPCVCVTSG